MVFCSIAGRHVGHFKEYKSDAAEVDDRSLGDEWVGWDGSGGGTVRTGKRLFIALSAAVLAASCALGFFFVYLISPRLAGWRPWLVTLAWGASAAFAIVAAAWLALLIATIAGGRNIFPLRKAPYLFMDFVFSRAFGLAGILGVSRDRLGHSFVRVSNAISRATKPKRGGEKLLVLLPRCLSREELKAIGEIKEKYQFEVHTVSGGELARKKVRELRPTAVIGVACERDLVSGIRDVGRKISAIGIPNERPNGPCKDTHIDMEELISAIEFYLGPPKSSARES